MEGSGVVIPGGVYSACLCVWRLSYVVDSCIVVATKHGQDKTIECMSSAVSLYSMLECKLCCEILLLLDMADIDCLCGRLWSEQC